MTKIWKIKSRICFDTSYYVVSTNMPDGENVLELAKDGYVPEFGQEPAGPEYLLGIPEEVTQQQYFADWADFQDVTEEEKVAFLINLDVKPAEDLSDSKEMIL